MNERLHGQSTELEKDFCRLTEEHDEASRTAQRRRAGNLFRYRRRRAAAHNVRTVDDAPFYEYVSAALRCTLVLVCVLIALGTFASGPDTGSDRTSARTAVVQMSYISFPISYLHTSPHGSSANALRSATCDLTTVNTDFRYTYATICYDRPRLASTHSYYQLQQNCSDACFSTPTSWPEFNRQTARQPQPASPITCNPAPAHLDRTVATSFSAHLRSTNPSASPCDCPNRMARTASRLRRTAQPLRPAVGLHGLTWSTSQYPTEIEQRKWKRKYPIFIHNVFRTNAACCLNTHGTNLCPGGSTRLTYAILPPQANAPRCRHSMLYAGMTSDGDVFAQSTWKFRRTGETVSMTVDAPQLLRPPQFPETPLTPMEHAALTARSRWGSFQALEDDASGVIFEAAVAQALGDQSWTIFLRIHPTRKDDVPPPPDSRDTKLMISAFVTEHFVADDGTSALTEPVKTGAIRTMTLADGDVPEKLITCDVRFNMDKAVRSSFIRRLFGSLGNDDDRTPLDIARRAEWMAVTPAVQDPDFSFTLMMQPSAKALNTGLTAYSEKSPREVKNDICAALGVTIVPPYIALFRRYTAGGPLTELVCWDHTVLSLLHDRVQHIGTPQFLVTSRTCHEPIRTLPIMKSNRPNALTSSSRGTGNTLLTDANPAFQAGDRTAVHPRVLRLPVNEPGNVGPTKTIFFRYSAGQVRDVITYVAVLLATFFASTSAPATFPATGTPQYWIERILPRTRANRPILFCIAASWGAIFAGVYEALQGEIITRIDSCTRIVLSTGLCLCIRCIGGMFCHRCGKPGHLVSSCTQDIFTPWREITFRCVCCRELGGVALGHEWDMCSKKRSKIQMGKPDAENCGICGHSEHTSPQCPSIQEAPHGTILLPKMRNELMQEGWILADAAASQTTTSSFPMAPASSEVTPDMSAVQPSSQSSTPARHNPWTTGSLSSSVSSTGSTVSLPGREDRVALANAEVMEVVRQALRSELEPINQRLGKLSDAVEMQGGNIASLTDMVDDIGERLRNVEAKESATQQRLARMREEFQQRQRVRQTADLRSELSQEDFQDAEAYDPMQPTDGPAAAPQRPGLESPATGMQT